MPVVTSPPTPASNPHLWLESHLDLVRRVVHGLARARRLAHQDRDELLSMVCARLIHDDYRALRQFRGGCRITTYLTILTRRVLLDWQIAAWGKWRPSAHARSMGAHVVELERRLVRDGVPLGNVLESVRERDLSGTLEAVATAIHGRQPWLRRRFIPLDGFDATAPLAEDPFWRLAERARSERRARILTRLRAALAGLPAGDRDLVMMRYVDGLRVSDIARRLHADPKRLYRRLTAISRELKARLAEAGITAEHAWESLDRSGLPGPVPYQLAPKHSEGRATFDGL